MAVIIIFKEISREKKRKEQFASDCGSEGTSLDPSNKFKIDSYLPIINQILLSLKTPIAAYNLLQQRFLFMAELKTKINCKIEESAKTLLLHYSDDLEESLPEEMIHFSALLKKHHFNSECSIEFQMLKFMNENGLMCVFPNVLYLWY